MHTQSFINGSLSRTIANRGIVPYPDDVKDHETLIKQTGSALCAVKNNVSNSDQSYGEQ